MAFFASTSLSSVELIDMLTGLFETLPSNGIPGRSMNASFGPLPWNPGEETIFETNFSSSVIKVLLASKPFGGYQGIAKQVILNQLFSHGGNGAPLSRAVREDNQLAYSAGIENFNCLDGGYWGFQVKTSKDNIEAVKKALPTMLHDPQLRSHEWLEGLKEAARCAVEMEVINPYQLVDNAVRKTIVFGKPIDKEKVIDIVLGFSHEEVMSWVDEIQFDQARVVIALGKG
jgi:predicted Zn-dependent peptidase